MYPTMLKRIQRVCLKCGHTFIAHGRYNRLCPRCKHHQARGLEVHRMIFPWT